MVWLRFAILPVVLLIICICLLREVLLQPGVMDNWLSFPYKHRDPVWVLCLWPGKAEEGSPKPLDLAPLWETWKTLLASNELCSSCCNHMGRCKICPVLFSENLPFQER